MTISWVAGRRLIIVATLLLFAILFFGIAKLRQPVPEAVAVKTNVPVHVDTVTRATLHRYVTAYGYVEPAPPGNGAPLAGAILSPIVGGVVAEVDAVEGRQVTQGSVLFKLDSRLAEVAVQRAHEQLDFAEKTFARQQDLMASNGTSQRAHQEAQQQLDVARSDLSAAETQLAYLVITAPLSGTVVRLNATVGQFVDANTVLAEIVDLRRLVVSARVAVRDIEGVAVGQRVLFGSDSTHGVVTVVGRDIDPATGSYLVRASVPSGNGFLPGQFVDVRITAEQHSDVLVVPEASVVTRAGVGSWVMLVSADQAVRRVVNVGLRERGLVEISGEGIVEGATVVAEEAYSLPEETAIQKVQR